MSIEYRLFGIPKTEADFVDKSKRMGQALNIIFYKSFYGRGGSTVMEFYDTYFELRLGERTLKLKKLCHIVPILPQEALTASCRYNQEDLEESIKIAERLWGGCI